MNRNDRTKIALKSLQDTFKEATHDKERRTYIITMSPEFRDMVIGRLDAAIGAINAHDNLATALEDIRKLLNKLEKSCSEPDDYKLFELRKIAHEPFHRIINKALRNLDDPETRLAPCPTCAGLTDQDFVEIEGGENGSEWHCRICKQAVV